MTSATPLYIAENDDDDDDFDWEAAVREIDVACQRAGKPSDSLPNNSSFSYSCPSKSIINNSSNLCSRNKILKKPGTSKQSTLDRFIGRGLGPENPTFEVLDSDQQVGIEEGKDGESVTCVEIDTEAAKTWIYPVNVPLRDYQLAITKTALFSNTLVALPTGLGKTLIAAVVMYNYFRWFPQGKIVFAAPSRPLVMQQIEACHNIVGIPQEWTIDMTGQLSPTKRTCFWKSKRVFFVTPQVLEKDIQSGTCSVRHLVCLVIDEAHRALGNYSYCVAVRELMAVPVQLRILALTATPGSKQQAIQRIIDNLQVSTLEYRNEDDPDVSPFVHNRKIELIEVALGKDAVDINKQLLDVIRPYVSRLTAVGLLQNRDYKTYSPPDLLVSRDKFRQAPPPELPQSKYGEIEACFAGLITLYHIRRLLSSHGIRPAYEMLEEKLKQGSFARLMARNEDVRKIKRTMEQSLSHGAPSPKLSKMLEVLVDHFKTKDPQNSRVIIFSNFRGSVRDIMDALTNISDLVKATEFIGQSSGKALKGQTQKVQQAVLEKFRAGKFNVIVATSIGEEGLDIMEVDLVICFDANVSPLRMIQRMGRTGRKHDGRVVVLACEGTELKGYMRKQANGRAIRKHMHNGGITSFNFHPSPRMIPHIFKPEVQFVEISIEQYVPRGKKVKDDSSIQIPAFGTKLNSEEAALITKYFKFSSEKSWRPSLIAFPHFQAYPSRVHKVMHSHRTDMLIDTMQNLQSLSFSEEGRAFCIENEISSSACLGVHTSEKEQNNGEDPLICDNYPGMKSEEKVTDCDMLPMKTKGHNVMDLPDEIPPTHSYLFGSDFVSVDALGNVIILYVPAIPKKEATQSKGKNATLDCLKKDSFSLRMSCEGHKEVTVDGNSSAYPIISSMQCETNVAFRISKTNMQQEKTTDQAETAAETPTLKKPLSNEGDCADEALDCLESEPPLTYDNKCNDDTNLSPRLTNMIQSGFVPESPINDFDVSSMKMDAELLPESPTPSPSKNETDTNFEGCIRNFPASVSNKIQTSVLKENSILETGACTSSSQAAEKTVTPAANHTKISCSNDWLLSYGDQMENAEQVRKLKRLRKIGDLKRNRNPESDEGRSCVPILNIDRCFDSTIPDQNELRKGKRKQTGDIFIEEEAEVSTDAEMSEDERDDEVEGSYDDSFIDDRTNPAATSTQAETCGVDMMAIYRRSLLSQSPMNGASNSYITATPDSRTSLSRMSESKSSSVKASYSLQTPPMVSLNNSGEKDSVSFQVNSERMSAAKPHTTTNFQSENETNPESKKRKLSFCSGTIPAINLEREFSLQSETTRNEPVQQVPAEKLDADDDQFFAGLDLDAVEAQATLLLKQRSESSGSKQDIVPKFGVQDIDIQSTPSFDLGIW